ncbi:MAG: DUF1295 domain-containing protein [Caulobacterales bacterium]|nr:DUF1295 domain-containing protein [Caulobacterales bacterium]
MALSSLLLLNAAVVAGLMVGLWLLALKLRDVSFIDAFWAFNMGVVGVVTYFAADGDPTRQALLAGLCAAWALRLGGHLSARWLRNGEDKRYQSLLARLTARGLSWPLATLIFVFGLQGALLLLVCLPVQIGQAFSHPPIGWLGWAGTTLAAFGLIFEAIADHQLEQFKSDPANAGQVMDRGLWRYTRHPNYFGDACVWWGLGLIACEVPGGWITLAGPAFLTFTLMKWSGAPLLEKGMASSRPGYADYVRRTSGFVPWPPRDG